MDLRFMAAGVTAAFFALPAAAASSAVDLSPWVSDGASWALFNSNTAAWQQTNSATTVLYSGQNDLNRRYTGQMYVNTTTDNDFIGLVMGYQPGDISLSSTNTNIDYLLLDWKKEDQGLGLEGMALSRVTGNIYQSGGGTGFSTGDAWAHTGDVQELARANTLGSTGWDYRTFYDFQVDYLEDMLNIYINGVLQFELLPSDIGEVAFNTGSFGFYALSQQDSKFRNVMYEDITPPAPVPLPAGMVLGLGGVGALAALRRLKERKAA